MFLDDYFTDEEILIIWKAKNARIDLQYYIGRETDQEVIDELQDFTPDFVLKCQSILAAMNQKEITKIRKKFKGMNHYNNFTLDD